jgi:hypothetical protein
MFEAVHGAATAPPYLSSSARKRTGKRGNYGKHNYGKSQFLMGKSTISMAIFKLKTNFELQ